MATGPEVTRTNADRFDKGIIFDKLRPLFGNGLANSNDDFHRRQRRLLQQAFHRKRIAGYVLTMTRAASDLVESWRPGEVVAVDKRMEDLALTVIGATLFSTELGRDAVTEVQRSMPILTKYLAVRTFSPSGYPFPPTGGSTRPPHDSGEWWPRSSRRRASRARITVTCCPYYCWPVIMCACSSTPGINNDQ